VSTLLKARARGVTREQMGAYLRWDEARVNRVWRAVNRFMQQPGLRRKVVATLCIDG
jgi:hypothetical protein